MKFKTFSADVLQFPFRAKRFAFVSVICFLALAFSVSAASGKDVQSADDARQLIKQAKKLTRKGELSEAEKTLRRVVQINPRDSATKLNLAYILLKQRQFRDAYDFSFEIARDEPKNSYAFAVLGSVLLASGNFGEAKTLFINSLQLDNREALAWAGLGTLNFYQNQIHVGLGQLQTAVFLEPSEPDFLFTMAQVAARAEDYKLSAEAYERFLQISPQTDKERRERIKGLINFLRFLGGKQSLYSLGGEGETSVPFRLVNDRPVIQLKVNGRDEPLNFVLDTGSGISVISNETAQKLKIKPITRGGLAHGVGGDGTFEIVYGFLRSVGVGNVEIRNVPVYIREFHSKSEKIDGYIGLSLISKFLTTIDYGDSTFALKKKGTGGIKLENEVLSLPLRLTSSGFLSGEVQLEGIETPLNFIIDTGASISVISSEIAGSKEISPFVRDEKMRVVGAAGVTEEMPSFLLPKISFGNNSCKSIKAVALNLGIINETSGFEQAGILGGNFLKNYRLTFDFSNSKVIFAPIK
ncbi:MAG: aspartyl protease family protein [Acidobacteriota bacterium]|nr:aspartyl protease family protein [Acidobacteriota bacterium]